MDDEPRERRSQGPAWGVAAVLAVVVVLLLIGSFNRDEPEPSPTPAVLTGASFLDCTDCHGDLDEVFKSGERPNLLFTHEEHFALAVSDCAACHVANTHERDRINRPEMVTCYACHGLEEGARASGDCALCHPPDMDPEPASHRVAGWLPDAHTAAAVADPFDCTTCHEQTFCDACHGTQVPHPAGFDGQPHAEAFFADPTLCEACHIRGQAQGRDECDACHHPGGPETSTWLDAHAAVVDQNGAQTCFQCHAQETCGTCHQQGVENFTTEDFAADRAALTGTGTDTASGDTASG